MEDWCCQNQKKCIKKYLQWLSKYDINYTNTNIENKCVYLLKCHKLVLVLKVKSWFVSLLTVYFPHLFPFVFVSHFIFGFILYN